MRTPIVLCLSCALAFVALPAAGAEGAAAAPGRWLMLVGTKSTDPAREAEFNHWYDDIDIPDVLKVPGYLRARRGQRQAAPGLPPADPQADDGTYVALYDIETPNIDRTMIEMLMAAKKMEMTGRSTDLLKVVERVYYRQHGPSLEVPGPRAPGKHRYLYLERMACCRDEATDNLLNDWYDNTHLADVAATPGLVRVTRYELYRVMMVEPKIVPRMLAVYEIDADSPAAAIAELRKVNDGLARAGRLNEWFSESGSTLYLAIRDVRRR